jgi:hypothetical protein
MRHLLKLILSMCICLNVLGQSESLNGRVTAYKFSEGLKYQTFQVDKKTFVTNNLEVLKTHEIDVNTFEINTSTNQFVSLFFANNCIVNVRQNSEFRVDLFNMTLKNTNPYPSKITVDGYTLNLALMDGEAYFSIIRGTNDQFMLQTPLSNLGLDTGKYYIQSTKKAVVVYILDGALDVYDNVTNKKESIKSGNAVLIHQAAALSPKQMELFSDKMVTNVKKAKADTFKPHLDVVNDMETIKNDVIFITVESKVIGVKIK